MRYPDGGGLVTAREIVVGGSRTQCQLSTGITGPMPLFSPSLFSLWLRLLLSLLGAASFGAGAAAVFLSTNATGTGVLIAFGGVVLVLALLGDRIESLEFGGAKLRMQAKPELWDFDSVLTAIKRARTPFEQYHALRLADIMLDDLDAADKQRLVEVVKGVRGRRFRRDTDRWLFSERILRKAGGDPDYL